MSKNVELNDGQATRRQQGLLRHPGLPEKRAIASASCTLKLLGVQVTGGALQAGLAADGSAVAKYGAKKCPRREVSSC